ncbi:prepilin-type processing-associated H-X9-DG domain-containing protein [Planctomicrobium piriforme]|uniref:Prepilin-type processing-associated H-X9-DG domain-containing protein n=2 Tax=Planctomicrobium piriforme TaxID=1576369 RepID=A0A1I3JY73_9PLAN|nr:prepilin-type processing-associated H-X9-DG domain-containing protein [Planctomicrobium piriforme]
MVELIVVMAIVAMLLALLIPAVTRAREAAKKTQCLSNLRNIVLALTQFDHFNDRLPASGYYFDPPSGPGGPHHSWGVSLLPFLDQQNVYDQWDLDKPITDPVNRVLTQAYVPNYVCPVDLSRSEDKQGDLSYAVNGGWGFTIRTGSGVGDCPLDWHGKRLDLNGDGQTCTGVDATDNLDRQLFRQLGLFFLENWKVGGTERHYSLKDVSDGTSQTFLVGENSRTGFEPGDDQATFADPNPYRSAFYVGNPCQNGTCTPGSVDYARCNAGEDKINSGLWSEEGRSPVPNSFHPGGVNMGYADGHVKFLSELIDGRAYAALASPQGLGLEGSPLAQGVLAGSEF